MNRSGKCEGPGGGGGSTGCIMHRVHTSGNYVSKWMKNDRQFSFMLKIFNIFKIQAKKSDHMQK